MRSNIVKTLVKFISYLARVWGAWFDEDIEATQLVYGRGSVKCHESYPMTRVPLHVKRISSAYTIKDNGKSYSFLDSLLQWHDSIVAHEQ